MKTGLVAFSIFDSKAGVYGRPFFFQSAGVAMRVFGDMVNDANEPVARHPEDYTLFQLATWDEDSGKFTDDGHHKSLANGIELVVFDELPRGQQDAFPVEDPSALMDIPPKGEKNGS